MLRSCLKAILVTAALVLFGFPLPAPADDLPPELSHWLAPQSWQRDVTGPIISLGNPGQFDDMHIFAPCVAEEKGAFQLWYSGSRGAPGNRVFRLGLATSSNGKQFEKYAENPVFQMADNEHSVLTPALLRNGDGTVLRENGKLRLWFASARLGKSGLHTLHETTSTDGIKWDDPSPVLLENVYCPTILKSDAGYEMWFSDVSRRPWILRHAKSSDGRSWTVEKKPVMVLSQNWEAEVLVYPTVLKIDGVYLMWYGSYDNAIRRETTAIGFAASLDGVNWHKHPQNPVHRPDPTRPWESNYVGSGCVMRLVDGSFRYWYASRKQPPFNNLYFAINTAHWSGPALTAKSQLLRLPPEKDDEGYLLIDAASGRSVETLETIDDQNAIVRAWYRPNVDSPDVTFLDLWVRGIDGKNLSAGNPAKFIQRFRSAGNQLIDTTCGKRSFVVLEAQ
jgi:predicted GH43/DUF377 family glycosyl hydrolase